MGGHTLQRRAGASRGRVRSAVVERLGGGERARVILLLAAVVGLETADAGAVGAVARQIEDAFGVGTTELGLVAGVSLLVGAAGTIPFGILADRVARVRVLGIVVALWSVAMVATGAAPTYTALLVSRLGLGVVTAAAMPLVASLIGDFFQPQERGRIYGLILTGEYLGTAGGLLLSGNVAAATSWRFAFWVLVPPGLVLSWLLLRRLDEPARGGRGRLAGASRDDGGDDAREKVSARGVEPDEDRVLRDPDMPLRRAVAWILRVPTNVTLIVASALGYFFFAGLRTFAVSLMRAQFGLSQSAATTLLVALGVAALAGVILGGRIGDRQVERGNVDARVVVPAIAYVGGAAFLLPGLLVAALPVALACFALGGAMLSAANPPLDAARLDIMPSFLWGRAESVRTVLRQSAQALAPLLFGIVADAFGGSGQHGSGRGGLQAAFLIMLIALPASAAVVWRARRHYARDVATAAASEPD